MRCSSACRGFLAAATVIGTVFFSLPASATLTPLPPTYDPSTGIVTIGVRVTDDNLQFATVKFYEMGDHLGQPMGGLNGEVFIKLTHYPFGFHAITVVISGPFASEGATFTYDVEPPLNWLPAVLDLLPD